MLIDEILDCYYEQIQKKGLNKAVAVPVAMTIEDSLDSEGWQGWKPASANIDDSMVKKIEMEYHIKIPSLYIDYINNRQFMDIEIDQYTLYGINETNTLETIVSLLPKEVVSKGLFPIGVLDNDDYVVLNTENGTVVELSYDDYSVKKILSENFNAFLEHLLVLLKC